MIDNAGLECSVLSQCPGILECGVEILWTSTTYVKITSKALAVNMANGFVSSVSNVKSTSPGPVQDDHSIR